MHERNAAAPVDAWNAFAVPAPLARRVLYLTLALFTLMLAWAAFGKLDIVAVSPGKLVPRAT